jgi:hypothetical protein
MLGLDNYMTRYPRIVEAMQTAYKNNKSFDKDYDVGLSYIVKGSTT